MEKLNLEILSVNYNGIEFRCEQWQRKTCDMRQEVYYETERSKWYSKDGKELDDKTAMKLLSEQKVDKEKNELIRKLWNRDDG